MKKILIGIFVTILFITPSCVKEKLNVDTKKVTKWDRPLFLDAPVAKATFSTKELLGRLADSVKKYIYVDEQDVLTIKYKDSVQAVWKDVLDLDDISFSNELNLGSAKKNVEQMQMQMQIKKRFTQKIKINSNSSQRFDKMVIHSADLLLNLDFPKGVTGKANIKFPEFTKQTDTLSFSYDLPTNNVTESKNIGGYELIFKHNAQKDSSYITMQIDISLTDIGSSLPSSLKLKTEMELKNIIPKVVFGYFGKINIVDQQDRLRFNFFEDFKVVDIVQFYEMFVGIQFDNYFGVPFNGKLKKTSLTRKNTRETKALYFKNNVADSNEVFVSPATYGNDIQPKRNKITFDRNTSNIVEALNFFPDRFNYHLIFEINPDDDKTIPNFVTNENKILGNIFVEIPLYFKTTNYVRTDTINNFTVFKEIDDNVLKYLDSLSLGLHFYNRLPFDLDAQVYFATATGSKVDSLYSQMMPILRGVEMDKNGKLTKIGETKVQVGLTKDKVKKYKDLGVEKLLITTKINTSNGGRDFVKLYGSSGLDCNVFVSVKSSKQD